MFKRPLPQAPPPPPAPGPAGVGEHLWRLAVPTLWTVGGLALLSYALFQKHLLPEAVGKRVAKLYFWPTMPFTLISRWSNYFTVMDDTVILGGAPLAALGHPDMLHALGVHSVLNMCDEYSGPEGAYKRLGMRQLRLPVVDHTEPTTADIVRGVAFIRECARRGERVLVHCKAGHGRSGAVAMGWLLSADARATPAKAQALMNSRRDVRKRLYRQQNVQEYYALLQRERDAAPPLASQSAGSEGLIDGIGAKDGLRSRSVR
ncbi:protein-tyrosine phosphatase-like protein [Tribonema minus]|uniref:Protein-tyrosine phosphatase-like protein n=1 Tax=Tribonema minus TaxID=303371 RepID=A0A835YX57_9STRA|nr:protein-tyrosine phosphatase-like protein [Tribonema minus]